MHAGYRRTYLGPPLRALARGSWVAPQDSDDRVDVVISVVELDSPSSAQPSVSTDNGLMAPVANRRAFNATSQYLIDAEVFGTARDPGDSDLDAGAVAHLVADKIP